MTKIFISYRRADSRKDAGRIYDRLVEAFGKDNIFKDVDSIPLGKDFRGILREAVAKCDILLAVIGRQWLDIKDESGNRRLDNSGDFVRIEIESALQRDSCVVIPVLVDGAPMPAADDLPLDLRELAFNNATLVRDDPDFHNDVSKIIQALGGGAAKPTAKPASYDVRTAIGDFYGAFDEGDWERARKILAEIRVSPSIPRVFNIDAHERDIWAAIEAAERDKEYDLLRMMAKRNKPTTTWEAIQVFWQSFPDYDPDGIGDKVRPEPFVGERHASPTPSTQPDRARHISPLPDLNRRTLEILPPPFEWIEIPAGQVTLEKQEGFYGGGQTFDVPAFMIAKYPVTNAQFAEFIKAGGYKNRQWWTEAGWQQRERANWIEPRFWTDKKWNGADYPVVGVSWYESLAFCQWLSEAVGAKLNPPQSPRTRGDDRGVITLPTEQQWQRAAQGDDGRVYPWGDEWDIDRCNNSVGKDWQKNQTSPVTQFQGKGDSPFGVVDMAGNVWEWCLTEYESGSNSRDGNNLRVLRGGSWNYDVTVNFRAFCRNRDDPSARIKGVGLRCLLS